jgi:hypothetical protein
LIERQANVFVFETKMAGSLCVSRSQESWRQHGKGDERFLYGVAHTFLDKALKTTVIDYDYGFTTLASYTEFWRR